METGSRKLPHHLGKSSYTRAVTIHDDWRASDGWGVIVGAYPSHSPNRAWVTGHQLIGSE